MGDLVSPVVELGGELPMVEEQSCATAAEGGVSTAKVCGWEAMTTVLAAGWGSDMPGIVGGDKALVRGAGQSKVWSRCDGERMTSGRSGRFIGWRHWACALAGCVSYNARCKANDREWWAMKYRRRWLWIWMGDAQICRYVDMRVA